MQLAINAAPLAEQPQSPAAFVIRERMAALRRLGLLSRAVGILPTPDSPSQPDYFDETLVADQSADGWGRLIFDQRRLPRLVGQAKVDLLWSLGRRAPLRSPVPMALEVGQPEVNSTGSFFDRLAGAMGEAGAAGVALRYGWQDSSSAGARLSLDQKLAPFVDPAFRATGGSEDKAVAQALQLPAAYVLSHGENGRSLNWLLAAWSWVDASVGDQIPLVLAGLTPQDQHQVQLELEAMDLAGSVMVLAKIEWEQLAALYRGAQAFLHSGLTPTGQEIRWALATGTPIAAFERSYLSAIAGGAAYLTPPGDARALGAACLTLLVEPNDMAQPLRQKGLMRASSYHGEGPITAWGQALTQTAGITKG